MRKPPNYWNKENCRKEAIKYKSKTDFIKHSMSAYNSAVKYNWLDEITKHMVRPIPYNKKWDEETCTQEALKYKSKVEFQKKSPSAYVIATTYDWFNKITEHMKRPENSNKIWFKENCKIEALKYNTRKEFNKKASGAYNVACKLKIIDDICSHMKTCGSLVYRGIYVYEFSDNHAYVGLTYNFDIRHQQHMNHKKSMVNKHIKKTNLLPEHIILNDYVDVYAAQKLEKKFYLEYKNNGWVMLNKGHTGSVGWNKLPK